VPPLAMIGTLARGPLMRNLFGQEACRNPAKNAKRFYHPEKGERRLPLNGWHWSTQKIPILGDNDIRLWRKG